MGKECRTRVSTTTPRHPHRGSNYRELIHTGCFECGLGTDMGGFESSFREIYLVTVLIAVTVLHAIPLPPAQSLKIHILSTVLNTFVWN